MIGGVDGVAGLLAGEVGEEEADGRLRFVGIRVVAQQELACSENVQSLLINANVVSGPGTELRRQTVQGLARRKDFVSRTRSQQ